jgi:DNA repair exonuclease SbcCD ATPase subunit
MASAKVATTRDAAFASPRIENVTLKSADETIAAQTKLREEYEAHSRRFSTLANTIEHREDDIERLTRDLSAAERNLQLVNDDMPTCYACGQELHDKAMKQALDTATKKLKTVKNELAIATLAQEEDVLSLEALNNETPEYDSHLLESAVSTRDLLVRQEELDNEHIRALDALKVADEELRNAKDRLARCKFVEVGQQEQVVTELEARYSWLTESVTNMGEELNGLRVAKAVAEASRAQRDELMASLDTYSENLVMLSFAEKAFGRDGIPAYLMDAALPAVEDTANELLSLMSEGTLSVRLATQRQTKSVGLKDALDIIVDDGTAERPFSTYSGGEGFRINFALRVALAEMVAQRSGLDLSMLVIDEPEGLDSSGRTALVQALTVIESRFDTIILVSHHEDLREALPQQVVVSKSPEGSRVKVSE